MFNDDEPGGEPVTRGEMSRAERIFVRLSILQTIIAVAGIFTAVVALYAALSEADAVRKQQAASVLPEVVIAQSHVIGDENASYFAYKAYNWGIGPGRVRAVRITYDGAPMRDWNDLLKATGAVSEGQRPSYFQSQIAGRTLTAEHIEEIFRTDNKQAAMVLRDASSDVEISVCYCSVFDECYLMPEQLVDGPTRVKTCPDYGDEAFIQ